MISTQGRKHNDAGGGRKVDPIGVLAGDAAGVPLIATRGTALLELLSFLRMRLSINQGNVGILPLAKNRLVPS